MKFVISGLDVAIGLITMLLVGIFFKIIFYIDFLFDKRLKMKLPKSSKQNDINNGSMK